ncbi:NACHT, LRR and PYD domains-containing protein 3-like [Cyprinus carpio]|uniref:NACHT, LRR and PYD domains-containing protein 3-like n=1 Tax=Cyprinus carpio TaxID=7962 RepID=A0A9Q9W8G0_CYPCA|nr:NACHT, LRR and PYD domains-containing protein 3-like [Cyprinus carpio]
MASVKELLLDSLKELVESKLKEFQWHLVNFYQDNLSRSELEKADRIDTVDKMVACFGPEEAVKIMVDILRKMNQNDLAEQMENKQKQAQTEGNMKTSVAVEETQKSQDTEKHTGKQAAEDHKVAVHDYTEVSLRLKKKLKRDYQRILIGNSQKGHQQHLNDIYTDLYVVENETGGIESEHEVIQIESRHSRFTIDKPIKCSDIFKVQSDMSKQKRVLTMGIAGVGKTVSVNKFILDWADGKENQDIVFIYPLPFRRLNLIKKEFSLLGLLNKYFFSSPEELPSLPEGDGKVVFIFDGLDECSFSLSFEDDDSITDVNEEKKVSVIITSLIKRQLVPSAHIWITSRPAAAKQIPRDYIDQVTEVRGFNDEQKEQYFIKNSSAEVAGNIIRHIRKFRSLYIMCHIPVFCWISLTVLRPLLLKKGNDKTPTTLTGMYTNFVLSQIQQMKNKYSDDPFKEIILKLGKLAFYKLMEGKLIFYKKDLEECELDVSKGSVFSGLCTEIFQEEKAVSETSIYSFVHLSVQEFLAALYSTLTDKEEKEKIFFQSCIEKLTWKLSKKPLFDLHKAAVKKALKSENGHLDLFLRFLLGLSLESNQSDIKEQLPELELKSENMKYSADYIKKKIEKEKSVERTINLFYCLTEMKVDLVEEIQKNLSLGKLSAQNLSSVQWSGLVFVLLMSEETQEKFEQQKYRRSDEAVMRLLPVIKNTRRALLHNCNLTTHCCKSLSSVLNSSVSVLRELDLTNNDLMDSGVKLLSDGLKSPNCQLDILRLSGCMVTEEGCGHVSSALSSNPSHLRELDLSYNHPGDSGVKLLSEKLKDPNCSLDKLNVDNGGVSMITAGLQKYAHSLTLDPNTAHTELVLSEEDRKVTNVREKQSYPDHPDRFDNVCQVLCKESVSGRRYWEIEWSGRDGVRVSVSYKSINRKGRGVQSEFGSNDQSWSLFCSSDRYLFRHNDKYTDLPVENISSRIGVFVDHSAGTLSFYSVSDTTSLIHTVQTTFTQPLYPGFMVYPGFKVGYESSVKLC